MSAKAVAREVFETHPVSVTSTVLACMRSAELSGSPDKLATAKDSLGTILNAAVELGFCKQEQADGVKGLFDAGFENFERIVELFIHVSKHPAFIQVSDHVKACCFKK